MQEIVQSIVNGYLEFVILIFLIYFFFEFNLSLDGLHYVYICIYNTDYIPI